MRLTNFEVESIRQTYYDVFKKGVIYLFGSRVDDSLKGGDIDLYIDSESGENMLQKKLNFLVLLKEKIGDQKIDVVISKDKTRVIEKEALKNGIRL
ncbi:MAG: nucleotidyltransferase domain-containing protein [Sulfurimonas sp.]|nr:nucleotidyltransferase domain-containing protein [Sulfurimonas sp.]